MIPLHHWHLPLLVVLGLSGFLVGLRYPQPVPDLPRNPQMHVRKTQYKIEEFWTDCALVLAESPLPDDSTSSNRVFRVVQEPLVMHEVWAAGPRELLPTDSILWFLIGAQDDTWESGAVVGCAYGGDLYHPSFYTQAHIVPDHDGRQFFVAIAQQESLGVRIQLHRINLELQPVATRPEWIARRQRPPATETLSGRSILCPRTDNFFSGMDVLRGLDLEIVHEAEERNLRIGFIFTEGCPRPPRLIAKRTEWDYHLDRGRWIEREAPHVDLALFPEASYAVRNENRRSEWRQRRANLRASSQ